MARKTLDPADITAIIDTREQRPWDLSPLKTVEGTLPTGDYSVVGLEHDISIERKSLEDLLGCVGQHRERFDKEMHRLLSYPCRAVIVEASWPQIEAGEWRSKVHPSAVMGSCLGWIALGIPIVMAGNAERAGKYAGRLMYVAANRRWHQLQMFYKEGLRVV